MMSWLRRIVALGHITRTASGKSVTGFSDYAKFGEPRTRVARGNAGASGNESIHCDTRSTPSGH
jgi:hypothetical protein